MMQFIDLIILAAIYWLLATSINSLKLDNLFSDPDSEGAKTIKGFIVIIAGWLIFKYVALPLFAFIFQLINTIRWMF